MPNSSPQSLQKIRDSMTQETCHPRIDHILRALDFEIDRMLSEQKQPGWTTWAILGGLATIVWLLFGQLESHSISATNVIPLFLVFSLFIDNVSLLTVLLSEPTPIWKQDIRFRLTRHWGDSRLSMLLATVRCAVLITIALHAAIGVWWPQVLLVCFIYGLFGIIAAIVFVLSFFRLPVPVLSGPHSTRERLMTTCFFAASVWSMIGYFLAVLSYPEGVNLSDYRVSILLAVAIYLIFLLTRGTREMPMLSSLVEVRRDLALGQMDVDLAIRQTDIILAGMQVADLLQEDVRTLLGLGEKASKLLRESARKVAVAESSLPDNDAELPEEKKVIIRALMTSCRQDIQTIFGTLQEMESQIRKFSKRVKWLAFISDEAKEAIGAVLRKIQDASHEVTQEHVKLKEKLDAFSEQLTRFTGSGTPEPSSPPGLSS